MLDLNSPRWSELRHAFGSAHDVPELLRALEAEAEPTYRRDIAESRVNPTPWEQVYSKLYHQGSLYSATFAAFPHIVDIAESGGLGKKKETLLLAGAINVSRFVDDDVPKDLMRDFDEALLKVRRWSLDVVRQTEITDRFTLPYLIQSFGGLRYPESFFVQCLDRLTEGDSEIEIDSCPQCEEYILVVLTANRLMAVAIDSRGHVIEDSARYTIPDRASYADRFAAGKECLEESEDPLWSPLETPDVLAALAVEKGGTDLAIRILDLESSVVCPHCGLQFEIREGVEQTE